MAKRFRLATSLLLGAAGGAAAAIFLASETGKKVKEKVQTFVADYQSNPEEVQAELVNKAQEWTDQVRGKYTEVKEQWETGEWTVEDVLPVLKEKAALVGEQSLETFEKIKEKIAEQGLTTTDLVASIKEKSPLSIDVSLGEEKEDSEEIIIDLTESSTK